MEPPPAPLDNAALGKPKTSILVWFAAHPIVGFVGTIASVLGIVLYFASITTRELSLYVSPSKTTIVKSGQSSELHILYKAKDVSTDVTALQVELWNAGKESIRPEHVLSPIILATSPRVPILEARLRHVSRPLTQIVLDTSRIADGKVAVSWKILEHNDAAVIQFIVAGPSHTSITASGALEGQSSVMVLTALRDKWWRIGLGVIVVFVAIIWTFYGLWLTKHDSSTCILTALGLMFVPPFVLYSLLALALHYYVSVSSLPIPFD